MNAANESILTEPLVLERRHGGAVFLMLNRPLQYNALSEEMLAALQAALDALAADASVRVVVLGGSPGRVHETVSIDLPRPRDQIATRQSPEFLRHRSHLYAAVHNSARGDARA